MAAPFRVRKPQKNRVFALVTEIHHLDPSQFDWAPFKVGTREGEALVHRPSGFYMRFEFVSIGMFRLSWTPPFPDGVSERGVQSKAEQVVFVDDWLAIIKEEIEAPDLWGAVASEVEMISADAVDGDRMFTAAELALLVNRIDQLERHILDLAPAATQEQQVHVHVTMEHAKEAATRVTRTDWKAIFVGQILGVIVRLGFEPDKAQKLLHYATLYIAPLLTRFKNHLLGP